MTVCGQAWHATSTATCQAGHKMSRDAHCSRRLGTNTDSLGPGLPHEMAGTC